MPDGISVELSGVDELLQAFEDVGRIGTRAALQDAMKKGAEVTAVAARRLAPRSDDIGPRPQKAPHLQDSIKVMANLSRAQKRKRGPMQGEGEIFVGSTASHAHLVEFGHVQVAATREETASPTNFIRRHRNKDGSISLIRVTRAPSRKIISRRVVGHVPARPFMRPAFDATKLEASKIIFRELGASLQKVVNRYAAQAARTAAGKGKLSRGAREAFRMDLGL